MWRAGFCASANGGSFSRRCLSRPKSFWSTCTRSPWSTSSSRTPCCTDTPSRWPPWCGCGSGWSHCEPICSAAGRRWPRICAAGKSHKCQTAPVCFSFRPGRVVRWSPRAFTMRSSWNSVVLPQGSSLTFSSEGLCLVEPSTMKIISQRNWRLLTHASCSHDGEDLSLPIG